MPKLSVLLLPLIAAAAPALGQTAAPQAPPPVSVTGTVERPDTLGCMIRMMDLVLLSKRFARNEKTSAEDRRRAEVTAGEADSAFFYYAGLLGADYFKTDRSAEGQAEFARMRAKPRDQQGKEMAMCLGHAQAVRKDVTTSLLNPKNSPGQD